MSATQTVQVTLEYGDDEPFRHAIEAERIVASPVLPVAEPDLRAAVRQALESPLDFPPLEQAVLDDDRVVLALEADTPRAATLIAECWACLSRRGVSPERVTILQATAEGIHLPDPREELAEHVRSRVAWKLYHPGPEEDCRYLASTANGERVYLAEDLVDADVVLSIGTIRYDSVLGYGGTHSAFFPAFSSAEAIAKARGQGHRELGPDDARPLRQMVDEVGWLLGNLFSLQVVPAEGGEVAFVLGGAPESVLRRGKTLLNSHFRVEVDFRASVVVAAIDVPSSQPWESLGAAVHTARNLVGRGGRIILLTSLAETPNTLGMELVRYADSPGDVLRGLRDVAPPDLVAASQLADALEWADVYLLSQLPDALVEEMFLVPVANAEEVRRLLEWEERIVFLPAAQHHYGRVRSE